MVVRKPISLSWSVCEKLHACMLFTYTHLLSLKMWRNSSIIVDRPCEENAQISPLLRRRAIFALGAQTEKHLEGERILREA